MLGRSRVSRLVTEKASDILMHIFQEMREAGESTESHKLFIDIITKETWAADPVSA